MKPNNILGDVTPPAVAVDPGGFNIDQFVSKILDLLIVLAVVLAVGAVIWAGVLYVSSAGDESKVRKAQQLILYAAVGVAVAVLGSFIVKQIFKLITGKELPSSLIL